MKKIMAAIFAVLLVLALAACQATPEQSIVKGKDLDKMIEKATEETAGQSDQAEGETLAAKLGAQATYTKELEDPSGKVKISVDAQVIVPDTAGITVQRVERGKFTQEQVDVLAGQLVKGALFSGDDFKLTKSDIQQKILEVQAAMAGADAGNTDMPDKRGIIWWDAYLNELNEQLKTAPDTAEKIPSTGKLAPMTLETDYATGEKLYALAQSEEGGYESLGVYNYDDNANFLNYTSEKNAFSKDMGYFITKEMIEQAEASGYKPYVTAAEAEQIPDIAITSEQAQEKAEALIAALGLENMACYSVEKAYGGSADQTMDQSTYVNPRKCVWFLRYARSVNGIPVTYTVWDCIKVEEDAQSAPWAYEDITFAIDDTGIVGFSWRSPYHIADTVTENSNLLSFSDIMSVFDTMSLAVNAWDGFALGNPNLTGIEIHVDQIRLGLTRITEQNKRDSGLLVPVWDFMGTVTYINETNGQTQKFMDGPVPVLTVNAIDGSIINRSLGY